MVSKGVAHSGSVRLSDRTFSQALNQKKSPGIYHNTGGKFLEQDDRGVIISASSDNINSLLFISGTFGSSSKVVPGRLKRM